MTLPIAARPPVRSAASALLGIALAAALLVDVAATYIAMGALYAVGLGGFATEQAALTFAIFSPLAACVANVVALSLGAVRVARRLPPGPRPLLGIAVTAAFAFFLASGLDVVLWFSANGITAPTPPSYELPVRIAVTASWVLTALIWGAGCVVSERRRRSGKPHVVVLVAAGLAMGIVQVGVWVALSLTSPVFA